MAQATIEFAAQLAPDLLEALQHVSAREGRNIQAILDEALRAYLKERQATKPREHVLDALQASIKEYGSLYEALAK